MVQLSQQELLQLAALFKQNVKVKNRRYLLRSYRRVFVGQEAVAWMVAAGVARSPSEAVGLGRQLGRLGLFHHVSYEHEFADDFLFYRFTEDDMALLGGSGLADFAVRTHTFATPRSDGAQLLTPAGSRSFNSPAPQPPPPPQLLSQDQDQQQQQPAWGKGAAQSTHASVSAIFMTPSGAAGAAAAATEHPTSPRTGDGVVKSTVVALGTVGCALASIPKKAAVATVAGAAVAAKAAVGAVRSGGGAAGAEGSESVGEEAAGHGVPDWSREVLQGHVSSLQCHVSRMSDDAAAQRAMVDILVSELSDARQRISELHDALYDIAAAGAAQQEAAERAAGAARAARWACGALAAAVVAQALAPWALQQHGWGGAVLPAGVLVRPLQDVHMDVLLRGLVAVVAVVVAMVAAAPLLGGTGAPAAVGRGLLGGKPLAPVGAAGGPAGGPAGGAAGGAEQRLPGRVWSLLSLPGLRSRGPSSSGSSARASTAQAAQLAAAAEAAGGAPNGAAPAQAAEGPATAAATAAAVPSADAAAELRSPHAAVSTRAVASGDGDGAALAASPHALATSAASGSSGGASGVGAAEGVAAAARIPTAPPTLARRTVQVARLLTAPLRLHLHMRKAPSYSAHMQERGQYMESSSGSSTWQSAASAAAGGTAAAEQASVERQRGSAGGAGAGGGGGGAAEPGPAVGAGVAVQDEGQSEQLLKAQNQRSFRKREAAAGAAPHPAAPGAASAAGPTAAAGAAQPVVPSLGDFRGWPDAPVLLTLHMHQPAPGTTRHTAAGLDSSSFARTSAASTSASSTAGAKPPAVRASSRGPTTASHAPAILIPSGPTPFTSAPTTSAPATPGLQRVLASTPAGPGVAVESAVFVGTAHVMLRGLATTPERMFAGKKRASWVVLQGRFKAPLPLDTVVTGQEFARPFARLPAAWFVEKVLLSMARKISPSMRVGPLSAPSMLMPIIASAQLVNVSAPGEAPPPFECQEDVRLYCPELSVAAPPPPPPSRQASTHAAAAAPATRPASADARRRHFLAARNRLDRCFSTEHVWTFHFWQQYVDLASYCLNFGYTYDLVRHLDGQPLQVMVKDVASGSYLCNVLVWHERLLLAQARRSLSAAAAAARASASGGAAGGPEGSYPSLLPDGDDEEELLLGLGEAEEEALGEEVVAEEDDACGAP